MRLLEGFLNFIVWAIHDIGRAIKHNPLTEAWRKIETPEWSVLRAPPSCKSIICAPEDNKTRKSIGQLTYEQSRIQRRIRQAQDFARLSADIEKHGSVKINEFGQKQ